MVKGNPNIRNIGRRFEKGHPGYKPKGTVNFKTRIMNKIQEEIEIVLNSGIKNQRRVKKQIADAMVDKLVEMSLKGDIRASQLIIDKVDGLLPQTIEQVNYDGDKEEFKDKVKKLSLEEKKSLINIMKKLNEI